MNSAKSHGLESGWRIIALAAGWLSLISTPTTAAPGPGLKQVTWNSNEIGTEVFRFPPAEVGPQPTFADFQHGYLYIGSAGAVNNSVPGQVNWYSLSNPRSPSRITAVAASGNKPHMAAFWNDRMIDGFQGSSFRIWDFDDKAVSGTYSGTVSPVWYFAQPPHVYRPRNGYGSGANLLEIARITHTGGTRANLFDLGTAIGFPVGALHAVGNLLICSASQARGVAVFDISDPAQPKLLGQKISGNNVYTSYVHGSRIYQCETGIGIRVYDFSNPAEIAEVGFIAIPNNPRYVTLKDGKGYCCPGAAKLVRFNTANLTIEQTHTLPAPADFVQVVGNMGITGGNQGAERCSVIPLQQAPDTAGPSVGFASPFPGAQAIPLTSRVGFIMSEPMDVTSLNTSSFAVRPVDGAAVTGTYSTQMGVINFSPAVPLLPDTTYEVVLAAGGVRDLAGNSSAQEYRMTFRTAGSAPDGSLARWRFNQTALDDSGNGHHATLAGGAVYATNAQEGPGSLELNGSTGRAEVASLALGDHFTLSAWVRIPTGRTSIQTIAANSGSGGSADGFRWFVNRSGNTDRQITFETGNGTLGSSAQTADNAFPYDRWNHVAVTVDRANGIARIYCNGTEVTTTTRIRSDFATTAALDLGRMRNNIFYLGGGIDDARILPGELTGTQIRALAQDQLLARWPFNGSAVDVSGNARDLVAAGTPTYSTDRIEGSNALTTGTPGYLSGDAVESGNEFSLAAWVKVPSGGPATIQTIFANSGGGTASGWSLYLNTYNTQDRKIVLETRNGTSNRKLATAADVFALDQWNHVAVTVNRTTGLATLYYNGIAQAATGSLHTDFLTNGPSNVGAFAGGVFRLHGNIDDVQFYHRILTLPDLQALAARSNQPPVIGVSTITPTAPVVSQSVNFSVIPSDADPLDTPLVSFSFGDNSAPTAFSTATSAAHVYTAPGRYRVNVRVSDGVAMETRQLFVVITYPATAVAPTSSSPILLDALHGKVWCANPDSGTITRMDAISLQKELEIPAGSKPRSLALAPGGASLWVACEASDELRAYDPVSGILQGSTSLGHGTAPVAVVFSPDGGEVFAASSGHGKLLKLDPATRTVTASLTLGGKPRAISVSGDSSRVLVTRFISPDSSGEVWEVNPTTLTLVRTFALAIDTTPDSQNGGRGLPNYLMDAAIAPDGRQAWVPSKKDNIQRGIFRDGLPLTHDNTVRCILSRLDLTANAELPTARIDIDNHSLPGAMAFSPRGDLALVAMQANNTLRIIDTGTGNALGSLETGAAPQAVCVGGSRAYVMNYLSRSISTFDLSGLLAGTSSDVPLLAETPLVAVEMLAPQVLLGKRIFYNAADERMAAEGYQSCAVCHLEGGHDGRTWDFTDRGEGLRNTTDLRGRKGAGHGFVHWSANFDEIQDFEHDMRGPFGGMGFMDDEDFHTGTRDQSLGMSKAGVSADLDALAAYVTSLADFPKSPKRASGGESTPSALAGRAHYLTLKCYECHGGAEFTDSGAAVLHDIGTMTSGSGKRLGQSLGGIDSPTLRGIFDSAPYLHDGSATTLEEVFNETHAPSGSAHAKVRSLSISQQQELIAFLGQLDASDVTAPVTDSEAWKEQQFGLAWSSDPASGDSEDPDQDGLVNRMEYVLGSLPNIGDPGASGGVIDSGDGRFGMTFTRNTAAADAPFVVEVTDTLSLDWTAIARSTGGNPFTPLVSGVTVTETGSGSVRQVTVRDGALMSVHPRRFMRLKAE